MLKQTYSKIISEVVKNTRTKEEDIVSTGFPTLDKKLNGGLRFGCCYLFTGLEKSGKSSFLLNIINERLMDDKPTGLLSTEMECLSVTQRMLSIADLPSSDTSGREYWQSQVETYFTFYGKEELTTGGKHDFTKFIVAIDEMEKEGIDFVVVDNLTTLGAEAGDYKVLGNYINRLMTHVKNKNMALIFVLHVKQSTSFKEKPEGIIKLVRSGKHEEIMTQSITVVGRPTLADVYGGGQALSQISGGTILLWRPFQKFDSSRFQKMGMLIIDSHRFGPSCDIYTEYSGETGKFKLLEK